MTAYVGMLPVAMVDGHPSEHPEAVVHGASPRGKHRFQLPTALFDDASD
ncbi:MAG TPA: hypothetical protein VHN38_00015 [Immundisolibacter sp.]|nr:hypothetical protein [Immundisolibacter sp.]